MSEKEAKQYMQEVILSTKDFLDLKGVIKDGNERIKKWKRLVHIIKDKEKLDNISKYCVDELWDYNILLVSKSIILEVIDVEKSLCGTLISRHYYEKQSNYIKRAISLSLTSVIIAVFSICVSSKPLISLLIILHNLFITIYL
jgi:hypothetical protein